MSRRGIEMMLANTRYLIQALGYTVNAGTCTSHLLARNEEVLGTTVELGNSATMTGERNRNTRERKIKSEETFNDGANQGK